MLGYGWINRKVQYIGVRSCPDRHFYRRGRIIIVEFKKPKGGRLSPGQVREIGRLKHVGMTVLTVWNEEDAERLYELATSTA